MRRRNNGWNDLGEVDARLKELTSLVQGQGQPNVNELWRIAKDLDHIKLNIKFFGYELARLLAAALPVRNGLSPANVDLGCKPSTQADLQSDWAAYWAGELKIPIFFHRKLWEYFYVLQALWENGCLGEGSSGVGFGCGREPLPSYFANRGIRVIATDLPPTDSAIADWTATSQHAASADFLFYPHMVSRDAFDAQVRFAHVNMKAIPADLRGHDFCWSICAMEHLGSIKEGLAFARNSLEVLKPGGCAVHTTEFNFADDEKTIDNWSTVLFQRRHFEELATELRRDGHTVGPLDYHVGDGVLDRFIDLPPYAHDLARLPDQKWLPAPSHLKLAIDGFAATCFGLIIRKAT